MLSHITKDGGDRFSAHGSVPDGSVPHGSVPHGSEPARFSAVRFSAHGSVLIINATFQCQDFFPRKKIAMEQNIQIILSSSSPAFLAIT
uniref:Uncharacterized protein n=1 Tax=Globodera rostochiensis TaxID=31243 RepID=A0A914HR03_GLORO